MQHSIVMIDKTTGRASNFEQGRYTRRLPPSGNGERINLFRTLAIGERVGNGRPRSFPFADEEVLSCAISAMRKLWHARCAMP
jgi:hypothetical protein